MSPYLEYCIHIPSGSVCRFLLLTQKQCIHTVYDPKPWRFRALETSLNLFMYFTACTTFLYGALIKVLSFALPLLTVHFQTQIPAEFLLRTLNWSMMLMLIIYNVNLLMRKHEEIVFILFLQNNTFKTKTYRKPKNMGKIRKWAQFKEI